MLAYMAGLAGVLSRQHLDLLPTTMVQAHMKLLSD